MQFSRVAAPSWQQQIPGARWLKADLHIHTIDDHAGRKAKMPPGVDGPPDDPKSLSGYARRLLQGAADRGVQVLGLTPHSPRAGSAPETSAVWKIVEEWNSGTDDDETPFRDKIYAVFPGFEPALKDGREGLHLLFLFDPEVGRDDYLKLYELAMGGISPWRGNELQVSNKSAEDVFAELRKFRARECPADDRDQRRWGYIVLAPHIDAPKGLFGAQQAQMLKLFEHGEIAGLELPDSKLPDDVFEKKPWLRRGMLDHRQAFFHGSDAYSVEEIGPRHTWLKLASPRIEALRQAFIASETRMRIGFERDGEGLLRPIPDPPDVVRNGRPWLQRVTIRGGASFFGGNEGDSPREICFPLSPDLTCLIGGSMTGKSTFLDGLRVHIGAPLPQDASIQGQVMARGRDLFAAGAPDIELACPDRDPNTAAYEQWPAQFFAQGELQRLSQGSSAVEQILAGLAPAETAGIEARRAKLVDLDGRLGEAAKRLDGRHRRVADVEQARERAARAKRVLDSFSEAGVDELHRISREHRTWLDALPYADTIRRVIGESVEEAARFEVPEIVGGAADALRAAGPEGAAPDLDAPWKRIREHLAAVHRDLEAWIDDARRIAVFLETREDEVRVTVERALADGGNSAARLKEFQELSRPAGLLPSYEAHLKETRDQLAAAEREFADLQRERDALVREQRVSFDRAIAEIERMLGGKIRARRVDAGDSSAFSHFVHKLEEPGIARWWSGLEESARPTPRQLLACLDVGRLQDVGMSAAVQQTFLENMTRKRKFEVAALRFPDRYLVELRMDDGSYRPLDQLSGGQRVSVLLSLLLESRDDRPLVLDQPEDELDNRFLFETVLPALVKLKGRRQVIVATHNANIVVNADADLVIQLDATAHRGSVVRAGAIEEPAVRDAIVRTVDGGEEAFRLRRRKYGF